MSILASQAPTNPDLDVEEEAAERQSLAAQTNGTSPADLQLSCKFQCNSCMCCAYSEMLNNWTLLLSLFNLDKLFSNQHGWGEEEVGQASPTKEIRASHWCTHTEVTGDIQGKPSYWIRDIKYMHGDFCKNCSLQPVLPFTDCHLYYSCEISNSVSFPASRWVLEHTSQNWWWSEWGLGESEVLLQEEQLSAMNTILGPFFVIDSQQQHLLPGGLLLLLCENGQWPMQNNKGRGEEGGNAFISGW